jgi:hypothetical protein
MFSVGFCTTVIAQETRHAYYTEDPLEVREEVITLPDKEDLDAFNDILQVQALMQAQVLQVQAKVLKVETEAMPALFQSPDGLLPSSSDAIVDDDFSLPPPKRVADPFSDDFEIDFDDVFAPLPIEDLPKPMDGDQQSFPATRLARGKVTKLYASAPSMVGDFFGGGFLLSSGQTVPIAGGDRRFKVAENVSPIPRDRISGPGES